MWYKRRKRNEKKKDEVDDDKKSKKEKNKREIFYSHGCRLFKRFPCDNFGCEWAEIF